MDIKSVIDSTPLEKITPDDLKACANLLDALTCMSSGAAKICGINTTHFRNSVKGNSAHFAILSKMTLYGHDIFSKAEVSEVARLRKADRRLIASRGKKDPLNLNVLKVAAQLLHMTGVPRSKAELKKLLVAEVNTYFELDWDNIDSKTFLDLVARIASNKNDKEAAIAK